MSAPFEDAYQASFAAAATAIQNGEEWSPLLILDCRDQVLGIEVPIVDGSLAPAIGAIRSSMPGLHPVEVAIVMDVWVGDPGSEVRPREDPASRSALMVVRQRHGNALALGREYWLGDNGVVTWAEEPVMNEPVADGAVIRALDGWIQREVSS